MPQVSGFRMPGRKISQTLWVPALHLLTGLLACGSESPVAMPLADVTGATEGQVENTEITLLDCCTRAATLQQNNDVLQRSLSRLADSLAASEARLVESERENTALRSRLDAVLSPEEIPAPTAASSQTRSSSSHTAQLPSDADRNTHPSKLPVFGAQLSDHWHGLPAEVACTHGGAFSGWRRVPGVCSCGTAWSTPTSHQGRGYPDPHVACTRHRRHAPSLTCILSFRSMSGRGDPGFRSRGIVHSCCTTQRSR